MLTRSIHADNRFVKDMLSPGGYGYILKGSVREEMITGIRKVRPNEVYFSSAIKGVVVSMLSEAYIAEGDLESRIKRRQINRISQLIGLSVGLTGDEIWMGEENRKKLLARTGEPVRDP